MTVYLVGAGPGDPGLLTRRGAQLLAGADVVLYDRLVHHSILALAPETAELIDVGKRPDGIRPGAASQVEINQLLVDYGQRKHTVVRLKGGDPFVFGRGGEEVEVLTQAGVRWEVVPGISSAFAVPAVVGIPVTHRGLSSSVTVVTGRTDDPTAPGSVNWKALAKVDGTVVILMGMLNRAEIAEALMAGGRPGSTPTAVIARGTTSEQAAVRTTLEQLAEVPLGSPSVIVVGPVAALGAETALSELTDFTELTDLTELADLAELTDVPGVPSPALSGRTVVVTRSGPRARGLVAALHDAGAATIEVPLTEQADPLDAGAALRAAAAEVGRFRWVIFTSVNAVTRFMAQLRDARSLRSTLVAAVGPATADALRRAGVEPDLIPEEHWANGLVAEFPDHDPVAADDSASDNEVLFPCAEKVPSTIPDGLAAKGWDVRRVVAYRTVALPPPEGEVLAKIAAADAVVFTAGSSATAYAALDGPEGSPLRVPPLVVCIGPTTAGVARALGMQGVEDAHGPSTSGIVDALIHHLDGRPAGGS